MRLKPQTNVRKKTAALERRKALLDALIAFIKAHPEITSEAYLKTLWGKTGLQFPEYALIMPHWKEGKAALRLVKSGEDWVNTMEWDDFHGTEHTVVEDVSTLSDKKLNRLLDQMHREANPEDYELTS